MWDATIYDKMGKERMQPSLDLISRIAGQSFKRIIDVGCGSGLSTIPLRRQWPDAEIVGVDLSDEMLARAKQQLDSVTWLQRDCSIPLDDLGAFDLVFSNAFLQWLKNQEEFLKNAWNLLRSKGVLAIQIPDFNSMPVSDCIKTVAAAYGDVFQGIDEENPRFYEIEDYYDILKRCYAKAEIWRVNYYHVMENHEDILEFIKGAALLPYLSRLSHSSVKQFQDAVLNEIKKCYFARDDGNVLFEFKRMFLLAEK